MKNFSIKFIALFGLFSLNALSFEATLSVNPPLISLGEKAEISIKIRGAKRPQVPVLPKVEGLSFSNAGQSSQTSIVNGEMDHYTAYTFAVYPQKTGEFTIGPFSYTISGETKTLEGRLNVVATAGDTTQPQSWSELLFARVTSSRNKAYVQEPFELTLSIYSRPGLQLGGNINLQGMPETGLSELEWKELSKSRELVDKQVYDVRKFGTIVRAMGSGAFEFAPTVTLQIVLPNQQRRHFDGFFDDAFSLFNRAQTRPVEVQAQKACVSILPLPTEEKPSEFSGAVGRFNFSTAAQPQKVRAGEPITVTMTIFGDGNFDRIMPPILPDNDSFRLYGDAVRQQENHAVRFEQVISPRHAEITEIPPITFSFFDTKSGQYRTVTSQAIPITVTGSSNETAQVFAGKESVILPAQDHPFATESDLQRIEAHVKTFWQRIRPWLWTFPVTFGLFLVAFLIQKIYLLRQKNTARTRRHKAPRAAHKALRNATKARKRGDSTTFYDALWNALTDYFGHRLNLPPGLVNSTTVLQVLDKKSFEPKQLDALRLVFDHLEASRYSMPNSTPTEKDLKTLQRDLKHVLKQCEKTKF